MASVSHANSTFVKVLSHHQSAAQHFGLLIFPYSLSFDYTHGSVPLVTSLLDPRNLSVLVMYAVLLYLAHRLLITKHLPFEAASILFILIPFIPSSNILFPVGFILAERVLYVICRQSITLLARIITSKHNTKVYSICRFLYGLQSFDISSVSMHKSEM